VLFGKKTIGSNVIPLDYSGERWRTKQDTNESLNTLHEDFDEDFGLDK
jgi:hypothetical protein